LHLRPEGRWIPSGGSVERLNRLVRFVGSSLPRSAHEEFVSEQPRTRAATCLDGSHARGSPLVGRSHYRQEWPAPAEMRTHTSADHPLQSLQEAQRPHRGKQTHPGLRQPCADCHPHCVCFPGRCPLGCCCSTVTISAYSLSRRSRAAHDARAGHTANDDDFHVLFPFG